MRHMAPGLAFDKLLEEALPCLTSIAKPTPETIRTLQAVDSILGTGRQKTAVDAALAKIPSADLSKALAFGNPAMTEAIEKVTAFKKELASN
jgi:hypothetical protein